MEENQENTNGNFEELLNSEENLNKAINLIKGKGYVVKPTEDYNKVEETLRKEIGSHFGSKLSAIDQTWLELGFEKEPNEPTEKFTNRVAAALKEENESLKKAREEGLTGAEGLKAENETLLNQLKEAKARQEELTNEFQTTLVNKEKESIINSTFAKLQIKEGLDKVITPAKKEFINKVLQSSVIEDGKLVFKAEDGSTLRNDKHEPISVMDLALKEFESVIETTSKKEGVGNGKETGVKSSLLTYAASQKPTNFDEAEAVVFAYFKQQGQKVVAGSKEYNQAIRELKSQYTF